MYNTYFITVCSIIIYKKKSEIAEIAKINDIYKIFYNSFYSKQM